MFCILPMLKKNHFGGKMNFIDKFSTFYKKVKILTETDTLTVNADYTEYLDATLGVQSNLIYFALALVGVCVVLVFISHYLVWERLRKFEKEITKFDKKFDTFKEWKNIEDNFRGFLSDSKGLTEYDRTVYLDKILKFVINNKEIVEGIFFFSIYDTLDKMIEMKEKWAFLRADRFHMKITEIKEIYAGGTIENKCNKFLNIPPNDGKYLNLLATFYGVKIKSEIKKRTRKTWKTLKEKLDRKKFDLKNEIAKIKKDDEYSN